VFQIQFRGFISKEYEARIITRAASDVLSCTRVSHVGVWAEARTTYASGKAEGVCFAINDDGVGTPTIREKRHASFDDQ